MTKVCVGLSMIWDKLNQTVVIASLSKDNKVQSITVHLSKEDYENAVIAHQHGKVVRIVGTLLGTNRVKMEDAIFSVLE